MRYLLSFFIFLFCACAHSYGQNLALAMQPSNELTSYSIANPVPVKKHHKQSALGIASGCSVIAGLGVYAIGYIKVEDANNQSLFYVNQSEINTGHTLEFIGTTIFSAGVAMAILDVINQHVHRNSKLRMNAPKNNEIGLVYKF